MCVLCISKSRAWGRVGCYPLFSKFHRLQLRTRRAQSAMEDVTIWQAWLGSRPLPGYLAAAHQTVLNRAGTLRVRLLGDADIPHFLPEGAAHPAYPHVPPLHRSEFVRAALMHHYGGVWLDIDAFVIAGNLGESVRQCPREGRREIDIGRPGHQAMIGPMRPNTNFTRMWLSGVTEALAKHQEVILRTAHANAEGGRGRRLVLSARGLQGDCGMSSAECSAWGRKRVPWEFILGDVWNDIARRLGMVGYNSMSCEYNNKDCQLACCTSHWHQSISCGSLKRASGVHSLSNPGTSWPANRPPKMCNSYKMWVRDANGRRAPSGAYGQAAHVMLGLSSQTPKAVKALDREAFLRSSTVLAGYARELLGMKASNETLEALEQGKGCVTNISGLQQSMRRPAWDALLSQTLQRWQ